jgi:Flp pilus assembly protein TadG|tara:strand:+ start:231 stop:818 length:588 start_codon:yes stop_codon:yes gene_type:complete
MACTALTKGRGLDCNRISGGIKNVYFSVYSDFGDTDWSYDSSNAQEIDQIDWNSKSIYKYVMPLGVASLTDTITGSTENGTIFYAPSVNIILNKLTKEDQNQIRLLGQTKVRMLVELNQKLASGHDAILCIGFENGLDLNTGTAETGAAFGDRNGYNLTFTGMESRPMAFLEDYTTSIFDNSGFTNKGTPFVVSS